MNDGSMRSAGWMAIASAIVGIIALVFLAVFFGIEFQPSAPPRFYLFGGLNDLAIAVQMALSVPVARVLHTITRAHAPRASAAALWVGILGLLGIIVLQVLIALQVLTFAVQFLLVLPFWGLVGVWLIATNYLALQNANMARWSAWLGILSGFGAVIAFVDFVLFNGFTPIEFEVIFKNPVVAIGLSVGFLLELVGVPIWAIGLGRTWLTMSPEKPVPAQTAAG